MRKNPNESIAQYSKISLKKYIDEKKNKHFRRKLRERAWKIEGIFAEGKENHLLRRTHYRGLSKVQVHVYLCSIVHNLKRLARRHLITFPDLFMQIWDVLSVTVANRRCRQEILDFKFINFADSKIKQFVQTNWTFSTRPKVI